MNWHERYIYVDIDLLYYINVEMKLIEISPEKFVRYLTERRYKNYLRLFRHGIVLATDLSVGFPLFVKLKQRDVK
jgi:hypothetical protein